MSSPILEARPANSPTGPFGGTQIADRRLCRETGNGGRFERAPPLHLVENPAVAGGDRAGGLNQGPIDLILYADPTGEPVEPMGVEALFQASHVRDVGVQPPDEAPQSVAEGRRVDEPDGPVGIGHGSIGPLYRVHVAVRAVPPDERVGAPERAFEGDQHVEAVDLEPLSGQRREPTAAHPAVGRLDVPARRPPDGVALAAGEPVVIPDERLGGVVSVPLRPQPGEIPYGRPKRRSFRGGKQ